MISIFAKSIYLHLFEILIQNRFITNMYSQTHFDSITKNNKYLCLKYIINSIKCFIYIYIKYN